MQMYITTTAMDFGDMFPTPNVARLLSGHVSPETAYVVDGQRCKVRHWLEYNPKRGLRWMAQTTNPGSKPQAATYCERGAVLYLDENGRVQCCTPLYGGRNSDEILAAWWAKFGAGVPEVAKHLKDNRGSLVMGITHMKSEIFDPRAA